MIHGDLKKSSVYLRALRASVVSILLYSSVYLRALRASVVSILLYSSVYLRALRASVVTFAAFAFLSLPLQAQFIRINLDIPAETGITETQPIEWNTYTDPQSGMQNLNGTSVYAITAAENLHVLVTLSHSDSLFHRNKHAVPLTVKLAYRNDGINQIPFSFEPVTTPINFPLSNSDKIITNMRGPPTLLTAYLYVMVSASLPQNTDTTYVGYVNLTFELN